MKIIEDPTRTTKIGGLEPQPCMINQLEPLLTILVIVVLLLLSLHYKVIRNTRSLV